MRFIRLAFIGTILSACGGSSEPVAPVPIPLALNNAPIVSAGEDRIVRAQDNISLRAEATDPDGDPLTFEWKQTSGLRVTLNNATSLDPNFVAPDVSMPEILQFEFRATDNEGAQSADDMLLTINPSVQGVNCAPESVPQNLRNPPFRLDNFYQRYCDANGIPVLGSIILRDEALIAAQERITRMSTELDAVILNNMIRLNTRIAIMAQTEVTTDIPEHADLPTFFPDVDWDTRARGLGATPERPASSGAEENLLCLTGDVFAGEDILVHEYAHTIHIMGLRQLDSSFDQRLNSAFNSAREAGLWENTFAGTNALEYWAEGVQTWFNVNQEPQFGIHNEINTRAELQDYDPALHDLIAEFMPEDYQPACP